MALCEPIRSRLWTLAAGLVGCPHDGEDLVQEAVCVALRRLGDFQAGSSAHAWLAQIVRMLAQNWNAKRRRRKTTAEDPVAMQRVQAEASPPTEPSRAEAVSGGYDDLRESFDARLAEALDQLSPVARACLLLRTVHDSNYDEISELVGVPLGTAMSHVHRARKALRKSLSPET